MSRPAVCILLSLALLACGDEAQRDTGGDIVADGAIDAFSMKVGDCFDDAPDVARDRASTLDEVRGVPCDEPHDNEIFASYRIALDEHPGDDVLSAMALKGCVERFESFVGTSYEASVLDTVPLYPTRRSWIEQSDRQVLCAIYRSDMQKLTGSMRDAAI